MADIVTWFGPIVVAYKYERPERRTEGQVISLGHVSAEFRGLVERRRRQLRFLFAAFASLTILVSGAARRKLPDSLMAVDAVAIQAAAAVMAILGGVSALREARIYRGLLINGALYDALVKHNHLSEGPSWPRLSVFNPFGVSSAAFLMACVTFLAALALFLRVVEASWLVQSLVLVAAVALAFAYFLRQPFGAQTVAQARLARDTLGDFSRDEWRTHVTASRDDAHRDMLELLAVAGLVTFSGLQLLSGLGDWTALPAQGLSFFDLRYRASFWLTSYMVVIAALVGLAYVRLRYAVGRFSVLLDPSDSPFRSLSLDDSFFGLVILATILCTDLTLLLSSVQPTLSLAANVRVAIVMCVVLLLVDRVGLWLFGRRMKQRETDAPPSASIAGTVNRTKAAPSANGDDEQQTQKPGRVDAPIHTSQPLAPHARKAKKPRSRR